MTVACNNSPENFESTPTNSGKVEEISLSTQSHKLLLVGLLLMLILTSGAAAYVFAQNQSLKSQLGLGSACEHEGETYQVGEGFSAPDSCNTCTCLENGQVRCTEVACTNEEFPLSITSDWDTYKSPNDEYSFKYPPDVNLNSYQEGDYDGISIAFVGPTQTSSGRTQTELLEGYGMNIIEIPNIDTLSLTESSWKADNQSSDPVVSYSISEIKEIEIGSKTGYQYEVSNRGSAIVTFVPLSNTSLRIVGRYAGFNPRQEDEYYKILDQILSTFEFKNISTQKVVVSSPNGSDHSPGDILNHYQITYEKPTQNSQHTVTDELYQSLLINDETFELSITFPTDGGVIGFQEQPEIMLISNPQIENITRFTTGTKVSTGKYGQTYMDRATTSDNMLIYTNNYSPECNDWNPKPAGGCGLMLVEFHNPQSNLGTTLISIRCTPFSDSGVKSCDKIVSSLQVEQLTN